MKKAMLSVPMNGRLRSEIVEAQEHGRRVLEAMGYEVMDTLFDETTEGEGNVPLYLLGRSIVAMSECHAVYFCRGWEKARGCRVEHNAAREYGLRVLYE